MFLHFDGFQPRNVLILFLFSMKQSDLLTAKITSDINNGDVSLNNGQHFITGWLIKEIPILLLGSIRFYTPMESRLNHKRQLWWCSGHSFVSKNFKDKLLQFKNASSCLYEMITS